MKNVPFFPSLTIAVVVLGMVNVATTMYVAKQQNVVVAVEPLLTDPGYHSVSDRVPCTDAFMSEEWVFSQSNDAGVKVCSDNGGCSGPAEERQGYTFFRHKTENDLVLAQMKSYIREVQVSCEQEVFLKN